MEKRDLLQRRLFLVRMDKKIISNGKEEGTIENKELSGRTEKLGEEEKKNNS